MSLFWRWIALTLILGLVAGCAQSARETAVVQPSQAATAVSTATFEPQATRTPELISSPTAAAEKARVWVDPRLPAALRSKVQFGANTEQLSREGDAEYRLTFDPGNQPSVHQVRWAYVLAARFAELEENVSSTTLRKIWAGGDASGHVLMMDSETQIVMGELWGLPNPAFVKVVSSDLLLDAAWKNPLAWAIIPFESLEPRWKVIHVDGYSVLDRGMDEAHYPLSVLIDLKAANGTILPAGTLVMPPPNREAYRIVSLVMSGTTALVRKTAQTMNERGVLFPAQDIGSLMRSADLTHVSNEVSFNPDCTPARAASPEGIFCSAPGYIQLLDAVGTDIVELTGNHNLDKGEAAYRFTLAEYQKRGWQVYGGGATLEDGRKPLLVQRGETQLAFLGCNMAGPDQAWASASRPGAATCDMNQMEKQVRALRGAGVLPIVTFQAFETEDYMPAPMQRPSDFVRMAEAGAVIVSGSQAHFPQGFGFAGSDFIHYGLGNLFFDQVEPITIRRSFIDRHIFYGSKYLGVELVTVMLEDYARPRLMAAEERSMFLKDVFAAVGWK